jgi:hypothetical protein
MVAELGHVGGGLGAGGEGFDGGAGAIFGGGAGGGRGEYRGLSTSLRFGRDDRVRGLVERDGCEHEGLGEEAAADRGLLADGADAKGGEGFGAC